MPDQTPSPNDNASQDALDRTDFVHETSPYAHSRHAREEPPASARPRRTPGPDTLSRNEVAAVSVDRSFYVSDMPSPYLSSRQAQEDVQKTKRRHSTIVTTVVVVLLLIAAGGAGWVLWRAMGPKAGSSVPTYQTATIELGEFVESVDTTALLQPIDEQAVLANVTGTMHEALVQEGSNAAQGDALFVLENAAVTDSANAARTALDTATVDEQAKRTALDEANAALATAQADLGTATNEAERIVTQAAEEAALKHAQTAQIEWDAANVTLQTMQQTFDRAQEQLDALTVRSPISGTVTSIAPEATVGTSVTGTTRLCIITDTSRLRVRIEVPAQKRGRVSEGQSVRLDFPTVDDLTVWSSISTIEDLDGLSVATVVVEEPDERISAGTAVEASIIVQSVPDSLMVPNNALTLDENGVSHLDVLLDPTRGIHSDVEVAIVAQDDTHAAVKATNIQEGNAVILHPDPNSGE